MLKNEDIGVKEEGSKARKGYDPKRQEFVMMYVIHK